MTRYAPPHAHRLSVIVALAWVCAAPTLARSAPEDPPATDPRTEVEKLVQQENRLRAEISRLEKEPVDTPGLNRSRIGLALCLVQRAILRLHDTDAAAFDDAEKRIREAERITITVDTGVLSDTDQRVYADLMALTRRAVAEEVGHLKRRIDAMQPGGPPAALPPGYVPEPPACSFYEQPQYVATARPRCFVFRWSRIR
jgi:HAMP domain-containing protein